MFGASYLTCVRPVVPFLTAIQFQGIAEMTFQRILVNALCSVTVAVTAFADRNPFAQWEQIQSAPAESRRSTAFDESNRPSHSLALPDEIRSHSKRRGVSVQFFSPNSELESESVVGATSQALEPQFSKSRTRMPVATIESVSGASLPVPNPDAESATFKQSDRKSASGVIHSYARMPSESFADSMVPVAGEIANPVTEFEETHGRRVSWPRDDEFAVPSAPVVRSAPKLKDDRFEVDESSNQFDDLPAESQNAVTNSGPPAVPNTTSGNLLSEHTGAQTPAVQLRWVREGDLNVGQQCRCALVVTNTGGSLVRNVSVEATVPAGLKVLRAVPAPQPGTSSWVVGDLRADESQTIELAVLPERRGDVNLNAFVRFTGYSTSVFTVQEPLLDVEVDGPADIEVGEHAGYVVRVGNPGTGTARNVVIQTAVPEGLQHRSGSLLSIDIGTLSPGESRQARLNLTAVEGGNYSLRVQTVADGGLRDRAATPVSVAEPRLQISIAGPDQTAAGIHCVYDVTVTNVGNVPSSNARAKYRIPANYRFVEADRGGVYRGSDQTIDWFVGTIRPGETATYHVTLEAIETGAAIHQAGVVSEHGKVTMARMNAEVLGRARLYLDVAGSRPPSVVGEETVLRLIIENGGSAAADKVGLSCEVPPGLEIIGAEGPTEHIAENGVVIFRSVNELKSDSQAVYLIRVRCDRSGDYQIRVRVASPDLPAPVIGETTITVAKGR